MTTKNSDNASPEADVEHEEEHEEEDEEEEDKEEEHDDEDAEEDDDTKMDVEDSVNEDDEDASEKTDNKSREEENHEDEEMHDEESHPVASAGAKQTSDADAAAADSTYSTRSGHRSSSSAEEQKHSAPATTTTGSAAATSTNNANADNVHQLERSVREAVSHTSPAPPPAAAREKPPSAGTGASFLDSLSEEERRTRTRFLPDVEGMHMLRKHEVKGDLALARSIITASGEATTISAAAAAAAAASRKAKKKGGRVSTGAGTAGIEKERLGLAADDDNTSAAGGAGASANNAAAMEIDEDDAATAQSEDDRASDILAPRSNGSGAGGPGASTTIEIGSTEFLLPSKAFVPPPLPSKDSGEITNGEGGSKEDDNNFKQLINELRSPLVVESVTAFNPPRPPESIGPKKKHRMLRWERRPADVEVDLSNYRKTVQRTREELHTAEDELERMESVGTHLRRHYLSHLKCLNEECFEITKELSQVQQECVSAANLLTSRTRSRGKGSTNYVMRDVLSVLKARGSDLTEKINSSNLSHAAKKKVLKLVAKKTKMNSDARISGIGGVSSVALSDWHGDTVFNPSPSMMATSWILPQDKVKTPLGKGVVVKVFGPSILDVHEAPDEQVLKTGLAGGVASGESKKTPEVSAPAGKPTNAPNSEKSSSGGKDPVDKKHSPGTGAEDKTKNILKNIPPRICVRLPFGLAFFQVASVSLEEDPSSYSDSKLASRWEKMAETAAFVSGSVDIEGMMFSVPPPEPTTVVDAEEHPEEEEDKMEAEVEEANMESAGEQNNSRAGGVAKKSVRRLIPFGSNLLTTSSGRGGLVFTNADIIELEKEIHSALYTGYGVLGRKSNEGVPIEAKKEESQRQDHYTLQARVLQLRNELYRQRRIRTLNERTFVATRDRSLRVEGLVTEMRSDLKSLKNRLDEELRELGIDEERAESILKAFYLEQEEEEEEEEEEEDADLSSPKRSRRLSHSEDVDHEDMDQHRLPTDRHSGSDKGENSQHHFSDDDDHVNADSNRPAKRARPNQ